MKKKQDGSVLLWAIMLIAVIMLIIVAAFSISSSYYQRSINNHLEKQSYITSKSSADALISLIASGDQATKDKLIPKEVNDEIIITDIDFELPSTETSAHANMGAVSATITKVASNQLRIHIKCDLQSQTTSLQVYLRYLNGSWKVEAYEEGE